MHIDDDDFMTWTVLGEDEKRCWESLDVKMLHSAIDGII